jgi:hypothetical protein
LNQQQQTDCENNATRDCLWISGYYYSSNDKQIEKSINDSTPSGICTPYYPPGSNFWQSYTQQQPVLTTSQANSNSGSTPAFSASTPTFSATTPGFGTGYVAPSSASSTGGCSLGNAKITIKWVMEKRMWPFNDEAWQCANEECTAYIKDPAEGNVNAEDAKAWATDMNQICYKFGDCGGYINWQNQYTENGYAAYVDYKRIAGSGGSEVLEKPKASTTGNVVADFFKETFS